MLLRCSLDLITLAHNIIARKVNPNVNSNLNFLSIDNGGPTVPYLLQFTPLFTDWNLQLNSTACMNNSRRQFLNSKDE